MSKRGLPIALCLSFGLVSVASARTPPLAPYEARDYTVSMPASWKIAADPGRGVIVAQQDPGRKDAADVLLIVNPKAEAASAEQLLDSVTGQFASGVEVIQREAIPGGGHMMVADGRVGDLQVRLAVVAAVGNGASVVCLLIAKPGDFDALGGMELVTTVLASIRAHAAPAPAPAPAPAAPQEPPGSLVVPPPTRVLVLADLSGEWKNGDPASITTYVNTYSGAYAGYSAIATRETWNISARGAIATSFSGVTAGNGGARAINEKHTGTVALSADGVVLQIRDEKGSYRRYVVRGWLDGPSGTILRLNGPWYQEVPQDILADPHKGWNLDSLWVRKPAAPH